MASRLNTEFDSRVLRTSMGAGGMTRPSITRNGRLVKVSCLNCGKRGGAVTADIPPALQGDPGVIWICLECDRKVGKLPLPAVSFVRYRNE